MLVVTTPGTYNGEWLEPGDPINTDGVSTVAIDALLREKRLRDLSEADAASLRTEWARRLFEQALQNAEYGLKKARGELEAAKAAVATAEKALQAGRVQQETAEAKVKEAELVVESYGAGPTVHSAKSAPMPHADAAIPQETRASIEAMSAAELAGYAREIGVDGPLPKTRARLLRIVLDWVAEKGV